MSSGYAPTTKRNWPMREALSRWALEPKTLTLKQYSKFVLRERLGYPPFGFRDGRNGSKQRICGHEADVMIRSQCKRRVCNVLRAPDE